MTSRETIVILQPTTTPAVTAQVIGRCKRETMTTTEAAEVLGIHPANIRQLIARGTLRAEKVGRDWNVNSKSVEAYRKHRKRIAR